jgi:hypothetical protein
MGGESSKADASLWRIWRDGAAAAGEAAVEPDALKLASYAEGRLGKRGFDGETDPEMREIEAWLAAHPGGLAELSAAREAATLATLPEAAPEIIARAAALIALPAEGVVPFRPRLRSWRAAAAWSGLAASLFLSTAIGFSAGADDWLQLNNVSSSSSLTQELLDPPGTVFNNLDLDGAI